MNLSSLPKVAGAGVLAISLAIAPLALPAVAQNNSESNNPTFDTTPLQETKNDFNNFGWLGLLGLIGLANLFRKRRQPAPQPNVNEANPSGYQDPNAVHPHNYTDPNAVGDAYTDPDVTKRPGYTDPDVNIGDRR